MNHFWAILIAVTIPLVHLGAQTPGHTDPANLDFEQGELGKVPVGWNLPKESADAGYTAQLTEESPGSGKRCAVLSRDPLVKLPRTIPSGVLTQTIPADPYRDKRIRLEAALRFEESGFPSRAELWLRVHRKNGQILLSFRNSEQIVGNAWRNYEVLAEVANDADAIELELRLHAGGRVWIDSVSLGVTGRAGDGNEPARPLQNRGLENLVAFTKLLGYVRYFHPSDEAAATKWDAFAVQGVAAVEPAKSPADLARTLEELFQPIAPTVHVFPTDQPAPSAPEPSPVKDVGPLKIVIWRHFGVGTGSPLSIYSSERVNTREPKPIPGRRLPELQFPDLTTLFNADLGGGVSCQLPLALYADEKGTLPRVATPSQNPLTLKPSGFVPTGNDRNTRLAAVALAWNVFQHFYPYFDVVQTDWPAALRQALASAASDRDETVFRDTLRRLVAELHDGHGYVSSPNPSSQLLAILPLRWDWIEQRLVVTQVAPDGAGGLRPGDVVLKVDGQPSAEALVETERLISGATPQWRRGQGLLELRRGPSESECTLEIQATSGQSSRVTVRRINQNLEPRLARIEEIKPGIVYLDLRRVTDVEFEISLPKLEKANGIVFDVRGYPRVRLASLGHLIDKPITRATGQIPVVLYPDRRNMTYASSNQTVEPKSPRLRAKVAFLTDGLAVSYAETYLGMVEQFKLAEIVGGPTAGTNGNINPFTLPGRYEVVWTGMKVLKQDGSRHHGVGIQPTVPVGRTIRGVAEGRDEIFERAVELVSQK